VLDTLKESDDVLRNNLANSLINSGLSAAAYKLGKKHDESKLELSKSIIESTSDYQRWRP
jgi:hypothetical protein